MEKDGSIAYEPARYASVPDNYDSKISHANYLRKRSIKILDIFGLVFFLVALAFFGIIFALGRFHDLLVDPGGIVGFVFSLIAILAYSVSRITRRFAPEEVLYGTGGTHNHLLGGEEFGQKAGTYAYDTELGGGGK